MSLIVQRFENKHIRLGVIADAQLSAQYGLISKSFKKHFDAILSEIK